MGHISDSLISNSHGNRGALYISDNNPPAADNNHLSNNLLNTNNPRYHKNEYHVNNMRYHDASNGGNIDRFVSSDHPDTHDIHSHDARDKNNDNTEDNGNGKMRQIATRIESVRSTMMGSNVVMSDSSVKNCVGGGIYQVSGVLQVSNTLFQANDADSGGGLSISGGNATVTSSSFLLNAAENKGGGIYIQGGYLFLDSSYFNQNSAGFLGGGVFVEAGGKGQITNCTFDTNCATSSGGAIAFVVGTYERLLELVGLLGLSGSSFSLFPIFFFFFFP